MEIIELEMKRLRSKKFKVGDKVRVPFKDEIREILEIKKPYNKRVARLNNIGLYENEEYRFEEHLVLVKE